MNKKDFFQAVDTTPAQNNDYTKSVYLKFEIYNYLRNAQCFIKLYQVSGPRPFLTANVGWSQTHRGTPD